MHSLRAEMVLHHPFNQQTCISVLSVGNEMNDQVPILLGSHRNKVYCQNIFYLFLCYWKIPMTFMAYISGSHYISVGHMEAELKCTDLTNSAFVSV